MSESEIFIEGIRYVSTRAAAKNSGLSQNYVSKICKSGFANARIIRGIWYIEEESFRRFLENQAEERSRWQQQLSRTRQAERSHSTKSYATGAAAITVHPRELHKYHANQRAKKRTRNNIALTSASLLVIAFTATQVRLSSITTTTQYAAVNNAFISLESSIDSLRQSVSPQAKVIYVGVVSPTIVEKLNTGGDSYDIQNNSSSSNSISRESVQMAINVEISDLDFVKKTRAYEHKISFAGSTSTNTLDNFVNSGDVGQDMSGLVVSLTAGFHGSVYYVTKPDEKSLTIYSTGKGPVSVILAAPRRRTDSATPHVTGASTSSSQSATSSIANENP